MPRQFSLLSSRLMWDGLFILGLCIALACGPTRAKEGESCKDKTECESPLLCIQKICRFGNKEGSACTISTECAAGLQCIDGRCAAGGDPCFTPADCDQGYDCVDGSCIRPGAEGSACLLSRSCQPPLLCSYDGFCQKPGSPGTSAKGEACKTDTDCQKELRCGPQNTCVRPGSEGQACKDDGTCDDGFVCTQARRCAKNGEPGTGDHGISCQSNDDCRLKFVCSRLATCTTAGGGTQGASCRGNGDCATGLICAPTSQDPDLGTCKTQGEPGTLQGGAACRQDQDCGFGLFCGIAQKCRLFDPYQGITCQPLSAIKGAFRVLFEVPRKNQKVKEFYRLPYPNDIRRNAEGNPDLSNHPHPETKLGETVFQAYLQAIQKETQGFGINAPIHLRLSQPMRYESMKLNGDRPHITLFNLRTGRRYGVFVIYDKGRRRYVCDHTLVIRTHQGIPLEHGATYGVLVTQGLQSLKGDTMERAKDFNALLQAQAPSDTNLQEAHQRYRVLREFLAKNDRAKRWPRTNDVVAATVFTTQDPDRHYPAIRQAAQANVPALKNWTLCDGKAISPCTSPDAPKRACGSPNEDFYEFHAQLTLPIYQQGQPPYKNQGGGFLFNKQGVPQPSRNEDVCLAITLPKGDMPAKGWPVLLHAHAVGSNFLTLAQSPWARDLAKSGAKTRFATVSYEQIQHGPRRGQSQAPPSFLVLNFRNPQAMKGNTLQAVADAFSVLRWLQSWELPAAQSPTQKSIRFHPKQIGFFGQGYGATVGSLVLAHAPEIRTAALLNPYGHWTQVLLKKESPVQIAASIRAHLGEDSPSDRNPAIGLIQTYLESIDPINFVPLLSWASTAPSSKHLFLLDNTRSPWTPASAKDAFAMALRPKLATPIIREIRALQSEKTSLPARGTHTQHRAKWTRIWLQRKSTTKGSDLSLLIDATTRRQLLQYFTSWLTDTAQVPTVPAP